MAYAGPTFTMITGPNGSGKTSLMVELAAEGWLDEAAHVSPDQIALDRFGDWDDQKARQQAMLYAANLIKANLRAQKTFSVEAVLSPAGVSLLRDLAGGGSGCRRSHNRGQFEGSGAHAATFCGSRRPCDRRCRWRHVIVGASCFRCLGARVSTDSFFQCKPKQLASSSRPLPATCAFERQTPPVPPVPHREASAVFMGHSMTYVYSAFA